MRVIVCAHACLYVSESRKSEQVSMCVCERERVREKERERLGTHMQLEYLSWLLILLTSMPGNKQCHTYPLPFSTHYARASSTLLTYSTPISILTSIKVPVYSHSPFANIVSTTSKFLLNFRHSPLSSKIRYINNIFDKSNAYHNYLKKVLNLFSKLNVLLLSSNGLQFHIE